MPKAKKKQKAANKKVKALKEKGFYLKTDRGGSFLYHVESGVEASLRDYAKPDEMAYFRKSLQTISAEVFLPRQPRLIKVSSGFYELNTYKEFEPREPAGSVEPFLGFLERLFPRAEERHFVTQFFAHMIQKPHERPSFALMLTSAQGTGKGYLYHSILSPLLSYQCVQNDSYTTFLQRFSPSLNGTLLCMLDDPKTNRTRTMTQMKSRISEPRTQIEEKNKQPRTIPVFTRIVLASNEKAPIRIKPEDTRRWYAPAFIEHPTSLSETQAFIAELDKNLSLEAIYEYLNTYDIEDFNPKNPPFTSTLEGMLEDSKTSLEIQIGDFLENNSLFKWENLVDAIRGGFHSAVAKRIVEENGFKSKRFTIDKKKQTFWYDPELPPSEIMRLADSAGRKFSF